MGQRGTQHTYPSAWKNNPNSYLYRSMNKHGIAQFTFTVLEIILIPTVDLLNERELFWMKAQNGKNKVNMSDVLNDSLSGTKSIPILVTDYFGGVETRYESMKAVSLALNASVPGLW